MSSTSSELVNEIVRAGAGAGKTTRLTQKVIAVSLEFYHNHNRWPKLVVTTFTRKATQELRERLIIEACKTKNPELIKFVSSKNMLFISTIHGVFGKFLRDYGQLFELDSNYTIISDLEAQKISRRVLKAIVLSSSEKKRGLEFFTFKELLTICRKFYEKTLEFNQLSMVTLNDFEQILKNELKVIGNDIKYQIDEIHPRIDPGEVWAKSLEKLRTTAQNWSQGEVVFEGLSPEIISLPRIAGKGIAPIKEELKELKAYLKKSAEKLLTHPGCQPENWMEFIERGQTINSTLQEFTQAFLKEKISAAQLEMSDIELISLYYLRKEPLVAKAFSSDWDFWLIDEYQDTSPLQVEILDLLIGSKPTYVVGDPQQSIYLFRGARSEVFAQKEQVMISKKGQISSLQKNWRSDPELLLFFNSIFARIGDQFVAMDPKSDDVVGKKKIATIVVAEELQGKTRPEKERVETESIISYIQKTLKEGASLDQICILGRTNKVLEGLVAPLESAGIPVHVHSAAGFYRRREIQDLLALVKFLVNPHDNLNFLTLVRSPWFRIDDRCLSLGLSRLDSLSHWSYLRKILPENAVISKLYSAMELARKIGVSNAAEQLMVHSAFFDSSLVYDSTGRRESNIWKLFSRLKREERKPGFNYFDFLSNSQTMISENGSDNEGDAVAALEPNRVNLMTVHSSKGLQFEHIIVPRMGRRKGKPVGAPLISIDEEKRNFSISAAFEETKKFSIHGIEQDRKMQIRENQENERLFYVALTRAKKSVFMSWCGKPTLDSWAELVKIPLSLGLIQTEHYSYEVVEQISYEHPPELRKDKQRQGLNPLLAPLNWEPLVAARPHERVSVTKLLTGVIESDISVSTHREVEAFDAELEIGEERHLLQQEGDNEGLGPASLAAKGVYIHKIFEILKYNPDYNFESLIQKWFGEQDQEVVDAIDFIKNLEDVPITELFQHGEVEWGFQLSTALGIVEGQIDLWGKINGGDQENIWIVDYKSGSNKFSEKAFRQLELYSLALRELYPETMIKLAVVYPLSKETVIRLCPPASLIKKKFNL